MKCTFFLSTAIQKRLFIETGNPQPKKFEAELQPTPEQAEIMLELNGIGRNAEVNIHEGWASFEHHYPSTSDKVKQYGQERLFVDTLDPGKAIESICQQLIRLNVAADERQAQEKTEDAEKAKQKADAAAANRQRILNNPDEARKVVFLQNNLAAMQVDQETHDYIYSVRNADSEAKTAAENAEKEAFRQWAVENGSELLKARIAGNFNWQQVALAEWFLVHTPEGFACEEAPEKSWEIKNPTLEQMTALKSYPTASLMRYKYEDESGEVFHRDFIVLKLTAPAGLGVQFVEMPCGESPDEDL